MPSVLQNVGHVKRQTNAGRMPWDDKHRDRSYKASSQGSPDISASKPQGAQRGKEVAERFQKQRGPAHSSFQASSLQKCEAIDLLVLSH